MKNDLAIAKGIQELDSLFHEKLVNYIKDKKEILSSQEKKDSIFTPIEVTKTRKQIDNIKKIIREIYEKRESKIVQLSLMNSRSQNPKDDKTDDCQTFIEEIKMIFRVEYDDCLTRIDLTVNRNENLLNHPFTRRSQLG